MMRGGGGLGYLIYIKSESLCDVIVSNSLLDEIWEQLLIVKFFSLSLLSFDLVCLFCVIFQRLFFAGAASFVKSILLS